MKKNRLLFIFLATVFFIMPGVLIVFAQITPEDVVINFVATEEQDEGVALDVFFTFVDGNGRPVPQANIESATIQVLGEGQNPIPAVVEDPQTPVYIALLIDTSGSMQNVMTNVRQAAESAIDTAPPTAYFSVIQFNETNVIAQEFTNDKTSVKSAITSLDFIPNKGTCLYDAVFDAVTLLDAQIQGQPYRRAVILFTDGKDQLVIGDDTPCSAHTYNEVINAARPAGISNPLTPIHTIGLADAEGDNLNEAELRSMAADTRAFSAIGGAANLEALFQEILDGLNSQLVARANICGAKEGDNAAVLALKVRENDSFLTGDFGFFSSREYVCEAPPPPAKIRINSLQKVPESDVYQLSLGLANPETIRQAIISVWDVRGGVQVLPDQVIENPENVIISELDTASLENEKTYRIQVQATDENGLLLEDDDENVILAEIEFTIARPTATFSIQAVNPDYENNQLHLDLAMNAQGADELYTYEGFIVDESSGGKVSDFGPGVLTGQQLQLPLPEVMAEAEEESSYIVTLYLITQGQPPTEVVYEFTPSLPTKPSLGQRVMLALANNPAISVGIVVVLILTLAFFFVQNWQKKKTKPQMARPPVSKTNVFAVPPERLPTAKPTTTRLHMRVIKSPGAVAGKEIFIDKFPYIIGREGCDFNIADDLRVSRQHLEITKHDNDYFVTDLGSSNKTYIQNKQLAAHQPTRIGKEEEIKVGVQTIIELKVVE
jgi:VWFA-related protein